MLRQELKQDISSFRYEVMGMMKAGRPILQCGAGAGAGPAESAPFNMAAGAPAKSKANRFKMAASLLRRMAWTPEAPNGLPNGAAPLRGRGDAGDLAAFHERHPLGGGHRRGSCHHRWRGARQAGPPELSRKMYPLSEEAEEDEEGPTCPDLNAGGVAEQEDESVA